MNFDFTEVKKDIKALKARSGDLTELKPLGIGGDEADVYEYASVAVKSFKSHKPSVMKEIKNNIKLSRVGIKRGINFAPYIDFEKKGQEVFAYMPKVDGVRLTDDNALEKLVAIGPEGLKKFFDDYIAVNEIGFLTDVNVNNYLVSDKGINMVDLGINNGRPIDKKFNCRDAKAILDYWQNKIALNPVFGPEGDKKKMLVKELARNTESVLSSLPEYVGN
ncbi:MAG: hypothetical protein LBG88_01980 [Christensenellaceae bacterium]|jgi:hypothetical protein|nr:hypothetical protein [Christensenellaceae bacterium]